MSYGFSKCDLLKSTDLTSEFANLVWQLGSRKVRRVCSEVTKHKLYEVYNAAMLTKRQARKYAKERKANPSDGEKRLIAIMGPHWFSSRGFNREFEVVTRNGGRLYLDFAHPRYKINFECDSDGYHMDVLKDEKRDNFLRSKGWCVYRFRWTTLYNRPERVRQIVEEIYQHYQPLPPKQRDVVLAQFFRSIGINR